MKPIYNTEKFENARLSTLDIMLKAKISAWLEENKEDIEYVLKHKRNFKRDLTSFFDTPIEFTFEVGKAFEENNTFRQFTRLTISDVKLEDVDRSEIYSIKVDEFKEILTAIDVFAKEIKRDGGELSLIYYNKRNSLPMGYIYESTDEEFNLMGYTFDRFVKTVMKSFYHEELPKYRNSKTYDKYKKKDAELVFKKSTFCYQFPIPIVVTRRNNEYTVKLYISHTLALMGYKLTDIHRFANVRINPTKGYYAHIELESIEQHSRNKIFDFKVKIKEQKRCIDLEIKDFNHLKDILLLTN